MPNHMARKLAPLRQSSPESRIRHGVEAAPNAGRKEGKGPEINETVVRFR